MAQNKIKIADLNASGTPSSSTFLRGDNTWDVPSGSGLSLEVEGTPNVDQTLLNLEAGTNMTITDNGDGSVTFDASGAGGGVAESLAIAYAVSL